MVLWAAAAPRSSLFSTSALIRSWCVCICELQGRTPLHHAVENHHVEMVEVLVSQGANIVAQNAVR